jgi:deoxyribonuclease V
MTVVEWPGGRDELVSVQETLGGASPSLASLPPVRQRLLAACFVCADERERAWAAAALVRGGRLLGVSVVEGTVGAPYEAGLLALREGPLLATAVRALPQRADVLLVNATGRDHPRRAGLALHLGAVMGAPSAGVTDRPLLASGAPTGPEAGSSTPLEVAGEVVGYWLRTRAGVRPVAVHAGWCLTPELSLGVVRACVRRARTPEPLRIARRAAREARARAAC